MGCSHWLGLKLSIMASRAANCVLSLVRCAEGGRAGLCRCTAVLKACRATACSLGQAQRATAAPRLPTAYRGSPTARRSRQGAPGAAARGGGARGHGRQEEGRRQEQWWWQQGEPGRRPGERCGGAGRGGAGRGGAFFPCCLRLLGSAPPVLSPAVASSWPPRPLPRLPRGAGSPILGRLSEPLHARDGGRRLFGIFLGGSVEMRRSAPSHSMHRNAQKQRLISLHSMRSTKVTRPSCPLPRTCFLPSGTVVVVDLLPDPAQPPAAAYPLTLPCAAALFGTMEARRYRWARGSPGFPCLSPLFQSFSTRFPSVSLLSVNHFQFVSPLRLFFLPPLLFVGTGGRVKRGAGRGC